MKSLRWYLILVLLGLSCSAAWADSADPKIKMQGGGGSTALFSPTDPAFAFTVFGGTTFQAFDFINATGQLGVGVDLVATLLANTPTLTFACEQPNVYFSNCTVTPLNVTQTLIRFFNPNTEGFGGLPFATNLTCFEGNDCETTTPGADFQIVVLDVNGDLANLPNTQGFSVKGTIETPEPTTVLLLLVGGTVFAFFKRRGAEGLKFE